MPDRRPIRVNVRWFGARGDGIHDDSRALIRAYRVAWWLNHVWPAVVFFPAGTYEAGFPPMDKP